MEKNKYEVSEGFEANLYQGSDYNRQQQAQYQ